MRLGSCPCTLAPDSPARAAHGADLSALTATSPSFPHLSPGEYAAFINLLPGEDQTTWSKRFRAWVRVRPLYEGWMAGAGWH